LGKTENYWQRIYLPFNNIDDTISIRANIAGR